MARKQILFVIVEGPSEEDTLGVLFNRLYQDQTVYIQVMHCDITSQARVDASNILSKIGGTVKEYAKDNHFGPADFKEVIHIIDMDGAYIPDENILLDETAEKTFYTEANIKTKDREKIIRRNRQKRENIDKLCSCSTVWRSIPYRAFYMSCNLDHVLYNKQNSTDAEKASDAFRFARIYRDNISGFVSYISCSDFSVMTDRKNSWAFIRQDLHSLQRYTNLGLFLKERET